MRHAQEDAVDEVLRRTDIVALISQHVHLKKGGRDFIGLCPFHEERTPSFTVSPTKQMFYCFGCQTGGSALTFVMKKEGLSFREALEILAQRAGVTLPDRSSPEARRRDDERQALFAALEEAARHFCRCLGQAGGKEVRDYLAGRGIDDQVAASFRLGYAPPGWDGIQRALGKLGLPLLEKAGLVIARQGKSGHYDRFRQRLMFPIIDHAGRVVGFGGRALKPEDEPKYLNSPETSVFNKRRIWYGFDRARSEIAKLGEAIVVEGYMDLVAAHRAGFGHAVASLGTALSSEQAMTLSRLAPKVTIAYDADAAGETATLRGLGLFRQFGARVMVCMLPTGEDPDSVISRSGPAAFRQRLESAVPLFDYRLGRVYPDKPPSGVEEKMAAVQKLLPVLLDIDDEVELDYYLGESALRLAIDRVALSGEVARARRRSEHRSGRIRDNNEVSRSSRGPQSEVAAALDPGLVADQRAELELVELMLTDPECARRVIGQLDPGLFSDMRLRTIAEAIAEASAGDDESFVARALARIGDEPAQALASRLAASSVTDNSEQVIMGLVANVRSRPDRQEIERLRRLISDLERDGLPVEPELLGSLDRLLRQAKSRNR